jgi:hypothetical protein
METHLGSIALQHELGTCLPYLPEVSIVLYNTLERIVPPEIRELTRVDRTHDAGAPPFLKKSKFRNKRPALCLRRAAVVLSRLAVFDAETVWVTSHSIIFWIIRNCPRPRCSCLNNVAIYVQLLYVIWPSTQRHNRNG